jgi:hypothetical protein
MRLRERQLDAQRLLADLKNRAWPIPSPLSSRETFASENLIRLQRMRRNGQAFKAGTQENPKSSRPVATPLWGLFICEAAPSGRRTAPWLQRGQFYERAFNDRESIPTEDLDQDDWKPASRD